MNDARRRPLRWAYESAYEKQGHTRFVAIGVTLQIATLIVVGLIVAALGLSLVLSDGDWGLGGGLLAFGLQFALLPFNQRAFPISRASQIAIGLAMAVSLLALLAAKPAVPPWAGAAMFGVAHMRSLRRDRPGGS